MTTSAANLYKITGGFCKRYGHPVYFVATILRETEKAVYLFGHCTTETTRLGKCSKCGRTLTHPVSVELGVGPECGQHWHNWDLIGGYTKENIARLKTEIRSIKVEGWFPRACIKSVYSTEDKVEVPEDHPMLNKTKKTSPGQKTLNYRRAELFSDEKLGYLIKVFLPYNEVDIGKIKTLKNRRYNEYGDKSWTMPICYESVSNLMLWGFELDQMLVKYLDMKKKQQQGSKISKEEKLWLVALEGDLATIYDVKEDEIPDIPGLKKKLYDFQKVGVAFLERKNGRAIIADEMGLGKTVQAIAYLQLHPELRPAVIVCPAVAKGVWKGHIKDWMTSYGKIVTLQGTKDQSRFDADIVIINYDILANDYKKEFDPKTGKEKLVEIPRTGWIDYIKDLSPAIVITDECHYYKNTKANRTRGIKSLAKGIKHFIAISGTPIKNKPIEYYNTIDLVDPNLMPNWVAYGMRYCDGKRNTFGWDFSGSSHTDELHEKLLPIMIRRTKAEVMKDLPDKTYAYVPLELKNRAEYDQANEDLIDWIKKNLGIKKAQKADKAKVLVKFNYMKQLTSKGKMDGVIEWIEDFLESGEKLVVFASYKSTIDTIMAKFGKIAVKIDGSVPADKRSEIEERFQKDSSIKLFVGNIQAAGVAITLTAASSVAFVELPWTPGELSQATDRCHRIGQKSSVTVYYLLGEDTIDESIAESLDKKRKILDEVLDGKRKEDEDMDAILDLINEYKGRNSK